jgi:hypothetical protein
VLTQPRAVFALECAQFLNATLKCCAVDLALTLKFDDLGPGRIDEIIGLDLRAH